MTNIKCTRASDRRHSALRTSKQHEQNKMTDISNTRQLFFKENSKKIMLNTVTLKADCSSKCMSKNQTCLYTERICYPLLLVHLLPQSAFNVTVFNTILLLFSLKKSSLLSTQNVGHFVLFMLFTCSQVSALWFLLLALVHFILVI